MPDILLLQRCFITLVFMAIVVALSTAPVDADPRRSVFSRLVRNISMPMQKMLHVIVYAALVLLSMWTLEFTVSRTLGALLSAALAISLGVVLEWRQRSVPGRLGTVRDVLLNGAGAIAGLILAMIVL